jgi:cytochrome c-type biogenesis protein CcmH/NrfF
MRTLGARAALLLWLLPLLGAVPAGESRQARIKRLQNALLAPCCYSEPVAKHQSDVARKMRAEIAESVAQGRSDRQILDAYKERYGARVLIEPEGAQRWWVYTIPVLAVLAGLTLTAALLRKWRANAIAAAGNPHGMGGT